MRPRSGMPRGSLIDDELLRGGRRPLRDPMRGHSLRGRLSMMFATFTVLLLVLGAGALVGIDQGTRTQRTVAQHMTPANDLNVSIWVSAHELRGELTRDEQRSDSDATRVRELRDDIHRRLDRITEINDHPELARLVQRQGDALDAWAGDHTLDAGASGPATDETAEERSFSAVRAANAEVSQWIVDRREGLWDRAAQVRRLTLAAEAIGLALAVALTVLAAVQTVRWVSRPLQGVLDGLDRLRLGELDTPLTPEGPREVRLVGAAVNHLADQTSLLRALREESTRLRRGTLDGALAVREKIEWADVVSAGLTSIGTTMDVDLVWFHPVTDTGLGECAGTWALPTFAAVVDVEAVIARQRPTSSVRQLSDMWTDGLVSLASDVEWVPADLSRIEGGGGAFGPGTIIRVPLVAGDEVMGCAVLLDTRGPRALSSEEVSALLVMASNVAVGLQHSRMFNAQRELVNQLTELDRQKTAFMSNVSHELRTPLTSIAGYTEMISDGDAGPVTPAMAGMLEAIGRNTSRLGILIDDLLALSRIESAAYRIAPSRISVSTLVDRAVETITPGAASASLHLVVTGPGEELYLQGDPTQLERCLLNLLSNAVKFTPAGGSVEVLVQRVERSGALPQVRLSVSDTGIGIPEADLKNLSSRFFRASNAVDQEIPGTGLGLAIVRGVIEHHGGALEVESTVGAGTTMAIVLPEALPEGVVGGGSFPRQRGADFEDDRAM